jgi:hypothetical protein
MLQPLDLSVFSALKHYFRCEMDNVLRMGNTHIAKVNFMELYIKSQSKALTEANILSGFKKAGLIPFSQSSVIRQLPIRLNTPPKPAPFPAKAVPGIRQLQPFSED